MPDGKVSIEISTDAAQTLHAWDQIKKHIADSAKSAGAEAGGHIDRGLKLGTDAGAGHLRSLGDAGKEFGRSMGESLAETALGFTTAAGAAALIVEGLKAAFEAQRELNREQASAATTEEAAMARFVNQARFGEGGRALSKAESREVGEKVMKVGEHFSLGGKEALGIGQELASQGVAPEKMAQFMTTVGTFAAAQGKDVDRQMAKAFVALTRVQDKDLGQVAADEVMRAFTGAFFKRQIQPEQLIPFSHVDKGLKMAGFSTAEQIALNVASLDQTGADAAEAATLDKMFVTQLQVAKASKQKTAALGTMGLDVTDVDFVGEGPETVLARLGKGLASLKAEDRVPALEGIFGARRAKQVAGLIEDRQTMTDVLGDIARGAPLAEGAAADILDTEDKRQATLKARQERGEAAQGKSYWKTADQALETELGDPELATDAVERWIARRAYDAKKALAPDTRTGAGEAVKQAIAAMPGLARLGSDVLPRIRAEVDAALAPPKPEPERDARDAERPREKSVDVRPRRHESELVGADPVAAKAAVLAAKDAKKNAKLAAANLGRKVDWAGRQYSSAYTTFDGGYVTPRPRPSSRSTIRASGH